MNKLTKKIQNHERDIYIITSNFSYLTNPKFKNSFTIEQISTIQDQYYIHLPILTENLRILKDKYKTESQNLSKKKTLKKNKSKKNLMSDINVS